MKADEINVIASKGQPMPEGLNLPEQYYYQTLRLLYKRYRDGDITQQEAKAEKHEIDEQLHEMLFMYKLYKHQAELEKVFHTEFHKSGTKCKAADCDMYRVLCGLIPKNT